MGRKKQTIDDLVLEDIKKISNTNKFGLFILGLTSSFLVITGFAWLVRKAIQFWVGLFI